MSRNKKHFSRNTRWEANRYPTLVGYYYYTRCGQMLPEWDVTQQESMLTCWNCIEFLNGDYHKGLEDLREASRKIGSPVI